MNATTEDRDDAMQAQLPTTNSELPSMIRCKRCNLLYVGNKSTSALRLTYCSFLCELGDLGFSMQGLEHMERASKGAEEAETQLEPEPVAVD
ncbi:MAG: hypothetical protein AB7N24_02680 [Dehalococcoidia bacterium]